MGTRNPIRQAYSLGKYATRFETGSDIDVVTDPIAADVAALQKQTSHLSADGGQFTGIFKIGAAPASASAEGVPGTVIFASSGIYVCTAENTWAAYTPAVIWP